MTAPNLEATPELEAQSVEPEAPIDEQVAEQYVPPQNAAPEIDYRALYLDRIRQQGALEAQLAQLQQQAPAPQTPRETLTDADIEKYGTVETLRRLMKEELSQSLADVGEISQEFKRNKQIDMAEQQFFASMPHYAQFRDSIASTVRPALQNRKSVDANTYREVFYLALGQLAEQQMLSGNQQQQPSTPQEPVTAPRQTPPVGRTQGTPVRQSTLPKLSELERTAIRRAGYDPNKAEDIKAFFADIDNDEGITV
jgi:hypothetical protein